MMFKLSGNTINTNFKIVDGAKYCYNNDSVKAYLANNWDASLSVTGADGIPSTEMAGNVIRPSTTVRLSIRLPPNMDCEEAKSVIRQKLTSDIPYGA